MDSLLANKTLTELDLSYTSLCLVGDLIFLNASIKHLKYISLEHSRIVQPEFGLDMFLNANIEYIDFSHNDLAHKFHIFENLVSAQTLILRNVSLQSVKLLQLTKLVELKRLDLSLNNLAILEAGSLVGLPYLEYLDLSSNQIEYFQLDLFDDYYTAVNPLKYLNLENNRIVYISSTLVNVFNLDSLKLSGNLLESMPVFLDQSESFVSHNTEFYFDHNQITTVEKFSYGAYTLQIVNFDCNLIKFIEYDAFVYLQSLLNLSMAHNVLTGVNKNAFFYSFNLVLLNLSHNRIETIETDSFLNLNKLKSLDLSSNRLLTLDYCVGLVNLIDLFLSHNELVHFDARCFDQLAEISNVYLNASTVEAYKCVVMLSMNRTVKRVVARTYKFYKSINLISESGLEDFYCELTLGFLQFNVHYNLKTDYANVLFYSLCQEFLAVRRNSYANTMEKCFLSPTYLGRSGAETQENASKVLSILSDFIYLGIMSLIICLLLPVVVLIIRVVKWAEWDCKSC